MELGAKTADIQQAEIKMIQTFRSWKSMGSNIRESRVEVLNAQGTNAQGLGINAELQSWAQRRRASSSLTSRSQTFSSRTSRSRASKNRARRYIPWRQTPRGLASARSWTTR
eukprot:7315792-Pyramimonas_sp.AAC.1